LRWTPPQPYGLCDGLLQATQAGSPCIQFLYFAPMRSSEDCLFLNGYTPKAPINHTGQSALPVMVWIHCGGLVEGSAEEAAFFF